MDTASRHARRIADSFIDDLDNMRMNSRNADRRAMSHFETTSYEPAITYPVNVRRRKDHTRRETTIHPSYSVEELERPFRLSRLTRRPSITRDFLINNKNYSTFIPEEEEIYKRKIIRQYESEPEDSGIVTRPEGKIAAVIVLRPIYVRSYSVGPELEYEEIPIRRTIRRSVMSSRLGSMPPQSHYTTVNNARIVTPRVYSTVSSTLPPRAPSRMINNYTTTRELPSVMNISSSYRYPETIIQPSYRRSVLTPIYHQYYAGAPSGYVPTKPSRLYTTGSYNDLSSDRIKRINRRLDDELLEYKPLSDDYFRKMHGSLRSLNDKITTHKKLIDRYSGIDMSSANESVADHIDSKYRELSERMGRKGTVRV